jgi:hypothetical protein
MDRAYNTNRVDEESVAGYWWEIRMKEITRKTKT